MADYKIKIHAEALDDIQSATDWYNEQSSGLGLRFQNQVVKQINELKNSAQLYAVRYNEVRCLLIKKFPFMVHYTLDRSETEVIVFAVFHTSLHPKIWDKRK